MPHPKILNYLKDLTVNNNRDWFHANKPQYQEAKALFDDFVNEMILKIAQFDEGVKDLTSKDCSFRIYRDTRFSKDKTPYKNNMGTFIVTGGKKSMRAGYYLHIEPDNSFVAGGIYMPASPQLKLIREGIYDDVNGYKKIIEKKEFKETYGTIDGEKLKNAPKGFPKDWEEVELIKLKSFTVHYKVDDNAVIDDGFMDEVIRGFKVLNPFNKLMNKYLEV